MGPRGAASTVFGQIAYNALPGENGEAVLAATCIVVLGSLLFHGLGAPLFISRLYGPVDVGDTLRHSYLPSIAFWTSWY
jgi:NhaP-type Na+/H+ or K+/H+ antiporter